MRLRYFILWLKEYESRYAAWLTDSGCTLPAASPTNSTTTLGDDTDPDSPCTPRDRDLSYINLIPSSPLDGPEPDPPITQTQTAANWTPTTDSGIAAVIYICA